MAMARRPANELLSFIGKSAGTELLVHNERIRCSWPAIASEIATHKHKER